MNKLRACCNILAARWAFPGFIALSLASCGTLSAPVLAASTGGPSFCTRAWDDKTSTGMKAVTALPYGVFGSVAGVWGGLVKGIQDDVRSFQQLSPCYDWSRYADIYQSNWMFTRPYAPGVYAIEVDDEVLIGFFELQSHASFKDFEKQILASPEVQKAVAERGRVVQLSIHPGWIFIFTKDSDQHP
jgi:hypothetical protein